MKYIIEIEDEPLTRDGEAVYRAKGFRSLVFDENGLKKLTPFGTPEQEETFHIGDEVQNDGEIAYVLVPDYGKKEFVLLMKGYTHPQYAYKQGWKKTGDISHEVIRQVELATEALAKERTDD